MPVITGVIQYATDGVTVQSVDCSRSVTFTYVFNSLLQFLSPVIADISFCPSVELLYSDFCAWLPFQSQFVLPSRPTVLLSYRVLLCSVIMSGLFVIICRIVPLGSVVLFYLPLAHAYFVTDETSFCSISTWFLAYWVMCVETRCCCCCYCMQPVLVNEELLTNNQNDTIKRILV